MKLRVLAWLLQYICEPAFFITGGIFFLLSLFLLLLGRRKSVRYLRSAENSFWYFLSQLLLIALSLFARKVFLVSMSVSKNTYPRRFLFLGCLVGVLVLIGLLRLRNRPAAKIVAPDRSIRKEDWDNLQEFPEQVGVFLYKRTFIPEERQRLLRGFLPQSMDDKWFVCVDENTLSFYRSWTGFYIYRLTLYPDGNHVVTVNKDPSQRIGANSNDAHRSELNDLIERLFLQNLSGQKELNDG